MPQIINTNIGSLTAQRNLNNTQAASLQALTRLSSGLRINSARDDAAGLAISTRFTAQVRGLTVAMRNANDGISLAQTAEGALGAMTESLQRLRELALQASNATNSDSDRQALNAEASQLIAELSRVSEQTNFNGRNLLDGSFSSSVQIGTNAGETVDISINQVTADKLGGGIGAGISSIGTSTALSSGDLIINGVAVGASAAADDVASVANNAQSAISKSAAINRVTNQTGVEAQVNTNRVGGSNMTATPTATTGAITLNGVTINITTGASSTSQNRQAVVDAINARSAQTGVIAVDTESDSGGVVLEAADGRNITIVEAGGSTLTEASTGLNFTADGTETFTGGFTLVSRDGSDISIDGGDGTITNGGNLANAGLSRGTFGGTTAAVVTQAVVTAAAATPTTATLAAGDLVINGVSIDASRAADDTASDTTANSSSRSNSAIAVAAAINRASAQTGVRATANATSVVGTTGTAVAGTADITINGVAISQVTVSGTTSAAVESARTASVDAINARSGQTGVTAADNGTSITLTAADGRNIAISVVEGAAGTAATIGLGGTTNIGIGAHAANAVTTSGTITLSSARELTVSAGVNGDSQVALSGFEQGTFGGGVDGQFLTEVDISTVEGAERALSAVDNALDTVNAERANLGAIQNRLDSTIGSLAINSENLSSARSRILDADFARETAELSRTQVLQQAGISILAQANAQPQLVLSLLQ
ncbi:MAG: flagellin [Pseudomonadales bacterium]